MHRKIQLKLSPEQAADGAFINKRIAQITGLAIENFTPICLKKSIDARGKRIWVNLSYEVYSKEEQLPSEKGFSPKILGSKKIVIVGFGPAGMFAALRLIEQGIKPIVLERGKAVKERRRDLAKLNKVHLVDPDSNYCFGEGGAGTFSDGKLYTRSKKRGDIKKVLLTLVEHGAKDSILFDSNPHIGTNKLPGIVEALRKTILEYGGEVHFNSRVTDFEVEGNKIRSVKCAGKSFEASGVILATGHSARDIFDLLNNKNITIESKPFALGVRIEHPQELIDQIQYGCARGDYLPPANYKLVSQEKGRGVFSFCMCPGGIIAPAATGPEEVVVNGWSPSKRNGKFANSGMVVSVDDRDFKPFEQHGPLRALRYQQAVERKAFETAFDLTAPAQRMVDFIKRKESQTLAETSYIPGIKSRSLDDVLPKSVSEALRSGLITFGKKLRGYSTVEAMLVGVESRTSSPVRIPRDRETLAHPEIHNLFPCGEGAGYAGGIMSAALDGIACANACNN